MIAILRDLPEHQFEVACLPVEIANGKKSFEPVVTDSMCDGIATARKAL